MKELKKFQCSSCKNIIEVPYGAPKPLKCPNCGASQDLIHRIDSGGRGMGRGNGRRCGRFGNI